MRSPPDEAHEWCNARGWCSHHTAHSLECADLGAAIENARAEGVVEAYASLPSIRARFTVAEVGDSLAVACESLGVPLDRVSEALK